jgi:hypothetical protein
VLVLRALQERAQDHREAADATDGVVGVRPHEPGEQPGLGVVVRTRTGQRALGQGPEDLVGAQDEPHDVVVPRGRPEGAPHGRHVDAGPDLEAVVDEQVAPEVRHERDVLVVVDEP